MSAKLAIALPLEPKLRDLTPDELDVLQIVLNHGKMVDVLDRSSTPDLETCQVVVRLVQKRVLTSS